MRKFIILLIVSAMASTAHAASTATHSVTVNVSAINEVAVAGGALVLNIATATAGSNPDDATDSSTNDLQWTSNESSKKITAETDLGSPNFALQVEASGVSGGTTAGAITLSSSAQDFVTGISTTVGSCDLAYTASATAAEGTGTDAHTVTYTITAI